MTQPDKLTIEEVEWFISDGRIQTDTELLLAEQLLEVMRENERLRVALNKMLYAVSGTTYPETHPIWKAVRDSELLLDSNKPTLASGGGGAYFVNSTVGTGKPGKMPIDHPIKT